MPTAQKLSGRRQNSKSVRNHSDLRGECAEEFAVGLDENSGGQRAIRFSREILAGYFAGVGKIDPGDVPVAA